MIRAFLPRRLCIQQPSCDGLVFDSWPQRAQIGEDVGVDVVHFRDRTGDFVELGYVALHRLWRLARVERMAEDLRDGDALLDVFLEHAPDEVLCAGVHVGRHREFADIDLLEEHWEVFVVKGEATCQKRVEYDLEYVENWSLLLDVRIIIKTVRNMIMGEKNAY